VGSPSADAAAEDAVNPQDTVPAPDAAAEDAAAPGGLAAACVASGGKVELGKCCGAQDTPANDFPNTCAIGACSCPPASSVDTQVCACSEGQCFDGKSCVPMMK
jgi:hypothetical protein